MEATKFLVSSFIGICLHFHTNLSLLIDIDCSQPFVKFHFHATLLKDIKKHVSPFNENVCGI